jgi:hypothetical protein
MFGFIGLIMMTTLLTTILCGILFGTNIIEIKNNWKERRCDPYVMFTAPLYQKSGSEESSSEFAFNNFMFCIQTLSSDSLASVFAPIYEILKGFFSTITVIKTLMNKFRSYFSSLISLFEGIVGERFQKFSVLFDLFRVGIKKLESAYSRNGAIITATLFQGMSGIVFMQNLVAFVVKVVIIIIAVLAALVIFLFFVMFPVIPIIITTIGILTAAGLGAAVGSYTGAFCLHPSTKIVLNNGSYRPINEINLGDILEPSIKTFVFPNSVYGILEVDGLQTNLYEIDGVKISGTHRVLEKGCWILAKDVARAKLLTEKSDRLYILNTKHHWVSATKDDKILTVSDWEEVSTKQGQEEWLTFVAEKLGAIITKIPTSEPLCGEDIEVLCLTGKKPISKISIGDFVFSENGLTRVLGIYRGYLGKSVDNSKWLSDGNWIMDGEWSINSDGCLGGSSLETVGYQLITESGSFKIRYSNKDLTIRDFTECGIENIEDCYNILDKFI